MKTKAYTVGLYEKAMPGSLSWKEKMLAAKKAGYDFIEISIDETDEKLSRLDMPKEERLELIELMYETGIPIRSMCLSGHRKYPLGSHDPKIRERGMEIMEKALTLAEDLGVRIIQLAGYDVYYEDGNAETREYFLSNIKKAAAMAASKGILMGFETMETEFMDTVEKAMDYVKIVDSVYLNVYPDLGNLTNASKLYGNNVLDDIALGKGHLAAMHLKETAPGKYREIPFGEGHVDFETGIKKAWETGVRRYVTEFWYTGNPGWKEDLNTAARKMTAVLDTLS